MSLGLSMGRMASRLRRTMIVARDNFRIATNVEPRTVSPGGEGGGPSGAGVYGLVSNFVSRRGCGDHSHYAGDGDDLEDESGELEAELAACRLLRLMRRVTWGIPPMMESEAALGSSRAGCVRPTVSRFVFQCPRIPTRRLNAAYGTTRADTVGSCDDNSPNTGFGMTFNFNLLDRRDIHDRSLCGRSRHSADWPGGYF